MKLERVRLLVRALIVLLSVMFILVDFFFDLYPVLRLESGPVLGRPGFIEFLLEALTTLVAATFAILTTNYLLKRLRYLEGLHFICAVCKKVRVGGQWISVESFVRERSSADFSHGYCPECANRSRQEWDRDLAGL
jgi:hypothetical protein